MGERLILFHREFGANRPFVKMILAWLLDSPILNNVKIRGCKSRKILLCYASKTLVHREIPGWKFLHLENSGHISREQNISQGLSSPHPLGHEEERPWERGERCVTSQKTAAVNEVVKGSAVLCSQNLEWFVTRSLLSRPWERGC